MSSAHAHGPVRTATCRAAVIAAVLFPNGGALADPTTAGKVAEAAKTLAGCGSTYGLDAGLSTMEAIKKAGSAPSQLACNEFVALAIFRSGVKFRESGSVGMSDLVEYFSSKPSGWSWTPRSDSEVASQVKSLQPGDVVFMMRDNKDGDPGAANGCKQAAPRVTTLESRDHHHVAIVVRRDGDGIVMAESGGKERSCIRDSGKTKGARIVVYDPAFVENTLFGFARP